MMSSAYRLAVWNKTGGHCAYCGLRLNDDSVKSCVGMYQSWMEIDHLTPMRDGGDGEMNNLVPSCTSCNASKGRKSLEAYRHQVAKKISGRPPISREVLDWLEEVGIILPDLPEHLFWFETQSLRIVGGVAA